jgi:hypothetical protein
MTTTAPSESELRERLTKEGMTLRKGSEGDAWTRVSGVISVSSL